MDNEYRRRILGLSFLIRPPTEPENGVLLYLLYPWLAIEGLFRHDRAAGIIAY